MADHGEEEIADEYRRIKEAADETNRRQSHENRAIEQGYNDVFLRAREQGLTNKQISEIVNSIQGGRFSDARTIAAAIRRAEEDAAREVERFVEHARVEAAMADHDIPEHEARQRVRTEERERRDAQSPADLARWEAEKAARRDRIRALVEWVQAEGNGVTIQEPFGVAVLDRVEPLLRPNARTRRWVAGHLSGYPADAEELSEDDMKVRYERTVAAREPMAARVIEFIRGLS
jgi:hypothetical protein